MTLSVRQTMRAPMNLAAPYLEICSNSTLLLGPATSLSIAMSEANTSSAEASLLMPRGDAEAATTNAFAAAGSFNHATSSVLHKLVFSCPNRSMKATTSQGVMRGKMSRAARTA